MTTGKSIPLTIRTFVGKVTSLLFKTLSRFVIIFLPRIKCLLISWLQSLSTVILEPKKIKISNIKKKPQIYLVYIHSRLLLLKILISLFHLITFLHEVYFLMHSLGFFIWGHLQGDRVSLRYNYGSTRMLWEIFLRNKLISLVHASVGWGEGGVGCFSSLCASWNVQ